MIILRNQLFANLGERRFSQQDSTLQKAISDGVIVSVPGPSNYKCSLCKKTLCGDAPAKQHLSGKEHLKNGASYILTNPSDKRQSLKKLVSPGLLAAAEKKVVQGMRCRICGLDFTGVAPLEQHVTGSDHAKKLQVLGLPVRTCSVLLREQLLYVIL